MKSAAAEGLTLKAPKLKKGEILVGAFLGADGRGHWTVLMPGHKKIDWNVSMAWAKKTDSDMPNRIEQAALHDRHKDQFERAAYWSNTQHAGGAGYAWYQFFKWGDQFYCSVSSELFARRVRRVPI